MRVLWLCVSVPDLLLKIGTVAELSSPTSSSTVTITPFDCWLVLAAPSVQRTLLASILVCLHEVVEREAVPRVSNHTVAHESRDMRPRCPTPHTDRSAKLSLLLSLLLGSRGPSFADRAAAALYLAPVHCTAS